MTTAAALRNHYVRESASTASPARLVTMLYDRLVKDLTLAETALGRRDLGAANDQLVHAQQIVTELRTSLDLTAWDGADGLAALYDWLLRQLVRANVAKDVTLLGPCRRVVEPLREAWHTAAQQQLLAAG